MRILYISDRQDGGILRHVKCLRECLPSNVETYEIGLDGDEEFAGRNGHDIREFWQIRRVVKKFKPDVVHLHVIPFFMALYLKFFTKVPRVCSLHTPSANKVAKDRHILNLVAQPCYFLAVSSMTWKRFVWNYPKARGEVFYNPIRFGRMPEMEKQGESKLSPIIGMVGRFADVKDWPSFVEVCRVVHRQLPNVVFCAVGVSSQESKLIDPDNLIEWMGRRDNAREIINEMDVLLMTSKSEEMPTVVLEAFAMGVPVVGFIPTGGVEEIVEMCPNSGLWRHDRDCDGLANDVVRLLTDETLREKCVVNAYSLVSEKFDAEKNCRGQLMDVYRRLLVQDKQ